MPRAEFLEFALVKVLAMGLACAAGGLRRRKCGIEMTMNPCPVGDMVPPMWGPTYGSDWHSAARCDSTNVENGVLSLTMNE